MMSCAPPKLEKLLGLFEIDGTGEILNVDIAHTNGDGGARAASITGHNFFGEVADFNNVDEFRMLFNAFRSGSSPVTSFEFAGQYADGPSQLRVLLSRSQKPAAEDSYLIRLRSLDEYLSLCGVGH